MDRFSVMNPHQRQPLRGGLWRQQSSVPRLEELLDPVRWDSAAGDVGEDTADRADHPSQEGLPPKEGPNFIVAFLDRQGLKNADSRLSRSQPNAEDGKVPF